MDDVLWGFFFEQEAYLAGMEGQIQETCGPKATGMVQKRQRTVFCSAAVGPSFLRFVVFLVLVEERGSCWG